MGKLVSSAIEIGTLGLVKDPLGIEAGQSAASEAAAVQERGEQARAAELRRQFDITQESLRPAIETGDIARERLAASLGLAGPEAESQFFQGFKESRGQQFLRQQQEKAITRNAAALGQRLGGNVLTSLAEQAEGRAAGRLGQFQNQLAALSGTGQTAATNVGQFGAQTSAGIGQAITGGAQVRASGILGRQQARTQATNQLLQLGGQFAGALI